MANEKITIRIDGDASDFQQESAKVKRSLKDIGSEVSTLSKLAQSQELRNIGQTLGRGFNAAANEVKALTSEFTNYATEVRKLNYLTGAGAEETSRLIQLADDLTINYSELGTALKVATSKGIDVSTKSLAALSDEYLKLAPGMQRADWLTEKFGRSGVSLAPLLEKGSAAIREMSDSIDGNMILTDEQIQKTREYELALDDFNDRVQGVRYSIGYDLVNAFMALPGPMQDFGMGLMAFGPQITGSIGFVGDLTLSLVNLGNLFKSGGLLAAFPAQLAAMGTAVKGFGVAVYTALGPIGMLIAALGLLAVTLEKFGPQALTTLKQLGALFSYGVFSAIGGEDMGKQAASKFSHNAGLPGFAGGGRFTIGGDGRIDNTLIQFMGTRGEEVVVSPPGKSGGGTTIIIQAQNLIGDADGIRRAIEPALNQWARARGVI